MVIYDDRIKCVYRPLRQFKRYSFANATSMHSNDAIHRRFTRSQTTKIPNKTQEKKMEKTIHFISADNKKRRYHLVFISFHFLTPALASLCGIQIRQQKYIAQDFKI